MKRITLAKDATWALALLTGAGAFMFALAYVAFPPRRPASPYAQWAAKAHEIPPIRDGIDFKRIVAAVSREINPPEPKVEENKLLGVRLDGTLTGPKGRTAAVTTRDGSQILITEKDRLLGSRITDIAPGTVTLENGASLNISRGERR